MTLHERCAELEEQMNVCSETGDMSTWHYLYTELKRVEGELLDDMYRDRQRFNTKLLLGR